MRTERRRITRHRAGAANTNDVVADLENGSRCLGRNTRDVAINEIVEHDIADAEDALLGNALERAFKVEHLLLAAHRGLHR